MDDVNIKIFDDGLVPFLSEYIVVRKSYLDWINCKNTYFNTKTNVNCHFILTIK
jgi:hypothetical protein